MYTREILPPTTSPIEDGKPVIGTWDSAFEKVDFLEIKKPFCRAMPKWLKELQLKEWQCFNINSESFLLEARFFNLKLRRIAKIMFYDKENNRKFVFKKIKAGKKNWHLPQSLANSSIGSNSSDFYFRIHSWLDADIINLDISIEATRKHPSLTLHLSHNFNSQLVTPMAVLLGFPGNHLMYSFKALAPVRGDMVFDGKHTVLQQDTCSGFFSDYKGFFPSRMHATMCYATGFDEKKQRFGFLIAENQTKEKNKNNENALWLDGKLTPLPPVLITMPNGHDGVWIIQDIEGMVDLTFTPKEPKNGSSLGFSNGDFNAPLGHYNGMLNTSEGEQIIIKNLFGIGEKLNLRV